ncbi:MAG: DUF4404 family protein [Gammaproteobacteria bacterium]
MTEKNRLREQLENLHKELEGSERLDDELQTLLGKLDRDIHRLLAADTAPVEAENEGDALSTQVREAATNFQAEHPRTYRVLREIADTLAKVGI